MQPCSDYCSKYNALFKMLRVDLLHKKERNLADSIADNGAQLDNCFGSMDWTKVFMIQPKVLNANQRACYTGHSRLYCLDNLTTTTPDRPALYLYSPEVGSRYDMIPYTQSVLDEALEKQTVINGE